MIRRALLLSALALVVAGPAAGLAQDCPRTSVVDLEDEVMCPVCGTTLGLAREVPLAARQRSFIQRLVGRCETKAEIKSALVAQFGEGVLAEPPDEGFGLLAYLVPGLAVLVGLVVVALAARRWRGSAGSAASAAGEPAPPLDAAAGARLEAELERLDRGQADR